MNCAWITDTATRRILAALLLGLAITAPTHAQDAPPADLYIGFPILFRENSSQLFGVQATATANVRDWLGISGDLAVNVGEVFADKSLWTALGGPSFRTGSGKRMRLFGHTLFGAATSGCGSFANGCRSATVFATAWGGGLDVGAGKRTRVRIQSDDLISSFGGRHQQYLRLSFGIVIPLSTHRP